jgi:transposase
MLTEQERERIRRAYHLEHKSIRQIAREEQHGRETIRQVLEQALPSAKPAPPRAAPVLGPYHQRIEALLQQNMRLPGKQRYTAHRIFEILWEEGYRGCESIVRAYVARLKHASQRHEVFLPLEFDPGQDAQVDWGEVFVLLQGERRKVYAFVMRLCYSRRTFVMLFPTQRQESFLYGHVQAFAHFGGVPHRISYDNLGTAVQFVREPTGKAGRPRREVQAFVAFRAHYLFESHFCTPAQGHEKGQVEGGVGFTRRNYLVPMPQGSSLEEINQRLLHACLADDSRVVNRQSETIGQAWHQERDHLLPLPCSPYECCQVRQAHLNSYGQVTYETNRYSVPVGKARKTVTLKAYPFAVQIWDATEQIASHPRSYDRNLDVLDPLHYLPLLEKRPGAFDYTKPVKQWRKQWPHVYELLLADLRHKWPHGRGVQEFVRILQLHQSYEAELVAQAIEQALALGSTHLDGVLYCLRQLTPHAGASAGSGVPDLDLSHRPDLDQVLQQPVDLSRYDRLLTHSW